MWERLGWPGVQSQIKNWQEARVSTNEGFGGAQDLGDNRRKLSRFKPRCTSSNPIWSQAQACWLFSAVLHSVTISTFFIGCNIDMATKGVLSGSCRALFVHFLCHFITIFFLKTAESKATVFDAVLFSFFLPRPCLSMGLTAVAKNFHLLHLISPFITVPRH